MLFTGFNINATCNPNDNRKPMIHEILKNNEFKPQLSNVKAPVDDCKLTTIDVTDIRIDENGALVPNVRKCRKCHATSRSGITANAMECAVREAKAKEKCRSYLANLGYTINFGWGWK